MISFILRLRFWITAPRIGADMPLTHWMLFWPRLGEWLGRRKLKHFGKGAEIRPYTYLVETRNISLGERVVLRPNTTLMAQPGVDIVIGDNVLIGGNAHFYVANHRFDDLNVPIIDQGHHPGRDIVVENDAWIGANVTVLAGVRIGRHAIVAAGSVVTRDIEPFSVNAGVPAKKIKDIS